MTSSGQIFTTEIWINVFENLMGLGTEKITYGQLAECRIVCKSWKPVVERVLFRVIEIHFWEKSRLLSLQEQLIRRPGLKHMIQDWRFLGCAIDNRMIVKDILRRTASPTLKTVSLIDGGTHHPMLLSLMQERPNNFKNLDTVPYSCKMDSTQLEMCRIVKKTLRSTRIPIRDKMKSEYVATRTQLLGECKKLRDLSIQLTRYKTKGRISDLDNLLDNCRHIETLGLSIFQFDHDPYSSVKASRSDISLMDVKKLQGLKRLKISFEDRTSKLRDIGPDWIEYLTTKYSKIEILVIEGYNCKYYHKLLPSLQSIETLKLTDSSFEDHDRLKNFIDVLKSLKNTIKIKSHYDKGKPTFKIHVSRSRQTASTAFTVEIYKADLQSKLTTFLKLCSDMVIQHLDLGENPELANAVMEHLKSMPSVKVLNILTSGQSINLHSIETHGEPTHADPTGQSPQVFDTPVDSAPNPKHFKLMVGSFEENDIHLPHHQLSTLALQEEDQTNDYLGVFLHVSTDLADQIFFARPSQPLLQASREDYQMCRSYFKVLEIKCKSLDRLTFKGGNVKVEMEFDDLGHWKQEVSDAMNSTYASLSIQNLVWQEKCKAIKEEQKRIEESYADLQATYSRAKTFLSDAVIKDVERGKSYTTQ